MVAYLSPFVHPKVTGVFSYFALGYPVLLFINSFFILFWLIIKPKYIWLSGLITLLGMNAIFRTIGFSSDVKNPSGLNIMSYNIGYARYYFGGKNSKNKIKEFKGFLKENNSDVICIQERAKWQLEIYSDIFKDYNLYSTKGKGTAIYSKLPVVNGGNIAFDTRAHNATWIDAKYNEDTIRVYCTHLSSNKVKNLTDNIKEIWDESIYILDKYNEHAVIRSNQVNQILNHSKKSPYPVVITGDFNDTPQSFIYNEMDKHYIDAFVEKGNGLGKTYMTKLPGLRIDYTFVSPDLNVIAHKILPTKLSDHYPVVSWIQPKK